MSRPPPAGIVLAADQYRQLGLWGLVEPGKTARLIAGRPEIVALARKMAGVDQDG